MPVWTGGRRIPWPAVPGRVRSAVEDVLGAPVVRADDQTGGFSAGLAARVHLADGRRAFVKAADGSARPIAATNHRREAAITRELPPGAPVPRLLGQCEVEEWVALVLADVPGRMPVQPWRQEELDAVLAALAELARVLTPAPVPADLLVPPRLGGWAAIVDDGRADDLATVSEWAAAHLADLVALEERGRPHLAGGTLQHGDCYAFNTMVVDGGAVVVDWPHAWVGAAHCDVVTLLSGTSLSGIDPEPLLAAHPLTRDLPAERVDEVLALQAGFLVRAVLGAGATADPAWVDAVRTLALASLGWLRRRASAP